MCSRDQLSRWLDTGSSWTETVIGVEFCCGVDVGPDDPDALVPPDSEGLPPPITRDVEPGPTQVWTLGPGPVAAKVAGARTRAIGAVPVTGASSRIRPPSKDRGAPREKGLVAG
jgi:hypothetical protein